MVKKPENELSSKIFKILKNSILPPDVVSEKESLLYKIVVGSDGKLFPKTQTPVRGQYAFQTDILIKDNITPLVVIELKSGGFSTHDILIYSSKALKHKEIYPYLRYGLIIEGDKDYINGKIFTHNIGFDFAMAVKSISKESELMIKIVKEQINYSKKFRSILKGDKIKVLKKSIITE